MDDLIAFLAARLDEDEADIDTRAHDSGQCDYLRGVHLEPERALRELAAKRTIVRKAADVLRYNASDIGAVLLAAETLRILSAVYSDHPDYRSEWKP